jgi:hypothetical protein
MSTQRAHRSRGQLIATAAIVAIVLAGGAYAEERGPAEPQPAGTVGGPSGAWFCPHGGGPGWEVTLELANPGPETVDVRVTHLSSGKPRRDDLVSVRPGTEMRLPFRADDRASGSIVEFFDGWVAAGWVSHAGGDDTGVAAEPCVEQAARRWYAPDGVTLEHDDAWVIVMNPFAADAVVSLTYVTNEGEITTGDLTNAPIGPQRVRAFRVNVDAEGYGAVGAVVDAPGGRVAVASLGLVDAGGARSALAQSQAPDRSILPASSDQGRSDVFVVNPLEKDAHVSGAVLGRESTEAIDLVLSELAEAPIGATSASAYSLTTEGPATLDLAVPPGVTVGRRIFGVSSDQASTVAAIAPAPRWVLLPAVAGAPSKPGLVLTNPGDELAEVSLSFLPAGDEPAPDPISVTVPPGRSINAPREFLDLAPQAAVVAAASTGTFVPAFASYSLGREGLGGFALSLGVPVPATGTSTEP